MKKGKTLISAIVGTSAMTLFSCLVSRSMDRNFREPEILDQLIKRLPDQHSGESGKLAGWIIHYTVGIFFVVIYNELWKRKKITPSLTSGAMLGAASGLAGIGGWKVVFDVHPDPPAKNLKRYFGHLMLAHIVFGISSAITYKLISAEQTSAANGEETDNQ